MSYTGGLPIRDRTPQWILQDIARIARTGGASLNEPCGTENYVK
jgi:hypothetical protein